MTTQFDLFAWADAQPSNIIQAREIFDRRAIDVVIAFGDGKLPLINGDVIRFSPRQKPKTVVIDRSIERA